MKNILYLVQVSNTTKVNGQLKWLLMSDACFNIALGICECLLNEDSEIYITLKVPQLQDVADIVTWKEIELFNNPKIKLYEEKIPISPIYSRFNFDFEFHSINKEVFANIDCVINDENTLAKNWRVFLRSIGKNIPIISTNYFLDSPIAEKVSIDIRYYERQMESLVCSDISAFQCKASMDEAIDAFEYLYKDKTLIKNKSVWGVGAHYKEISKYHDIDRFKISTIYFGNRISDSANRYTNWDSFCDAIGILVGKINIDFNAYILNPTKKITEDQRKEIMDRSKNKIIIIENDQPFTREDYLKFINKAHISCNLFTTEVHGGVTHAEALMANNIVIMPDINNYRDKFDNLKYPFMCSYDYLTKRKVPNAFNIAMCLMSALALDDKNRIYYENMCRNIGYKKESYEMAVKIIIKDLNSLIKYRKN